MNLRQLRYISAVARNGLNVSATAERLYTSQPGVSKQIRQLEDELGVQIFERSGRQLTRVTQAGRAIIELAERALVEVDTLRQAALEHRDPHTGTLSIASSHTQARYVLPDIVDALRAHYPRLDLRFHQGAPEQIARLVTSGDVDLAIATEGLEHFEDLVLLPCYRWQRAVVVRHDHPLAAGGRLDLRELAAHPLVTYVFAVGAQSVVERAFRDLGLEPRIALSASDAEVVKTYVRRGVGAGVIARMAWEPERDADLVLLDASHVFEPSLTKVAFRRGSFFRACMYDFLHLFAPHLTRDVLDTVLSLKGNQPLDPLFVDVELPLR
ncbi:MAG: HTH-type transcriptional regulator CysB [Ectothiorhodospiraceae bacterium]|nr:HTH-type transcriptional regulator CysB [Chromatiales bacterium]MCP5154568.1 HTH-type transcriptional regulator CysB [Ectothiorhodospiraceae bacterium]